MKDYDNIFKYLACAITSWEWQFAVFNFPWKSCRWVESTRIAFTQLLGTPFQTILFSIKIIPISSTSWINEGWATVRKWIVVKFFVKSLALARAPGLIADIEGCGIAFAITVLKCLKFEVNMIENFAKKLRLAEQVAYFVAKYQFIFTPKPSRDLQKHLPKFCIHCLIFSFILWLLNNLIKNFMHLF